MTNTLTSQLKSFHIIQKTQNNETLITWTFPSISAEQKSFILKKVFTVQEKNVFACLRLKEWFYLQELQIANKPTAICLITIDYDPDKYETLCNVLIKKYQKSENAVEVVKLYLAAFTQGSLSMQENGTLITYDFKRFPSVSHVKEIIKAFGLEAILIYNALLLKKRMLVYHQSLRKLQKVLLSITKIMLHRNPNDYLYPIIDDILELRGKSFFVAGTLSNKCLLNSEHYDLCVDLSSQQITTSSHAKDSFTMTKMHKDIAVFMVQQAEDVEISEQQMIFAISSKTQDLLYNLKSLASAKTLENDEMITMEVLKARKLSPAMENFLFNLAVAENMMML